MKNAILKFTSSAIVMFAASNAIATAKSQSSAYLYEGEGIYSELDYLCDSTDGKKLIAVIKYTKGHASHTMTYDRAGFKQGKNHWVKLGEADAGAGQIRYALTDHTSGKPRGYVHTVNPGMLGDPAKTAFPALSSVTLDGERSKCRFDKDAVFFGVTDELSHMILRDGDKGYKLKTWSVLDPGGAAEEPDFDSASTDAQGNRIYIFAIGHTSIHFKVPPTPEKGGASVTYQHDSGQNKSPLIRAYIAAN